MGKARSLFLWSLDSLMEVTSVGIPSGSPEAVYLRLCLTQYMSHTVGTQEQIAVKMKTV